MANDPPVLRIESCMSLAIGPRSPSSLPLQAFDLSPKLSLQPAAAVQWKRQSECARSAQARPRMGLGKVFVADIRCGFNTTRRVLAKMSKESVATRTSALRGKLLLPSNHPSQQTRWSGHQVFRHRRSRAAERKR